MSRMASHDTISGTYTPAASTESRDSGWSGPVLAMAPIVGAEVHKGAFAGRWGRMLATLVVRLGHSSARP